MKVVFICGALRANSAWDMEQNIRKAEELSLALWRLGYAVICPHTNTRFFQGATDDEIWLRGYIEILKRCDAIALVDGWERSEGARGEYQIAQELGLGVIDTRQVLE